MANTEPSESPSASVALRSPDAVESSEMDALISPEISDASSTALMVRLIVIEDEFPSPSENGERIGTIKIGIWLIGQ